jgi:hypothetical protein
MNGKKMTAGRAPAWAAALAVCLLAGAAGPANAGLLGALTGGDKPKTLVLEEGSDMAAALVEAVNDGNPFAKVSIGDQTLRKVAISAFQVKYVTDSSVAQTKSSSFGSSSTSRSAVAYKLEGPTPEQLQAITEQARERFVQLLAERGYEVLPPEALLADASFAALAGDGAGAQVKGAGLLSADGVVVTRARGTADLFGIMGMTKVMGLSDRLQALMLNVKLVVNFASLEEMGWADRVAKGAASGVTHEVRLSVDTRQTNGGGGEESGLWVVTGAGVKNPYPLRRKVYLPSPFAKEVRKLEKSTGEVAFGVLSSLMGNSAQSSSYLVVAADDYPERVAHDLGLVDQMLAEALPRPR